MSYRLRLALALGIVFGTPLAVLTFALPLLHDWAGRAMMVLAAQILAFVGGVAAEEQYAIEKQEKAD